MSGAYPLSSWNVHNLSCRTNNHMEGWHSKLKKVVGKAHPNVFEIVRIFKMEQAAVDVAVAQLLAGAHPPVRSQAAIEKDTKIEELKASLQTMLSAWTVLSVACPGTQTYWPKYLYSMHYDSFFCLYNITI